MESSDVLFTHNRIILAHFDSYSAALVFARWDQTLLMPAALPESAMPMDTPAVIGSDYDGAAVMQAAIERYGLKPAELMRMSDFDAWLHTDTTPIRIHVLRFTTIDAPKQAIELQGGIFKSISELRSSSRLELTLLRQVFNLVVGGQGGRQ